MRGLLLAVAAPLIAPLLAEGQVVPIALHGAIAVASVRLNGQGPFRMILDTGATSCSMVPSVASKLRLKAEYQVFDVTPSDNRWLPGSRSVDVTIGDLSATNVEFLSRPSSGFDEAGLDVDGVLGQSFLARFDYRIDYQGRRLILSDAAPLGKRGKRIPFTLAAGRMLLSAASPLEGTMRLILDSAASNVYVWRATQRASFSRSATLITMNGHRAVNLFQMPVLMIGDQVLNGLDAVVAPPPSGQRQEDGLLPASLFRSVYVSNSESYVKLER